MTGVAFPASGYSRGWTGSNRRRWKGTGRAGEDGPVSGARAGCTPTYGAESGCTPTYGVESGSTPTYGADRLPMRVDVFKPAAHEGDGSQGEDGFVSGARAGCTPTYGVDR